MNPSRLFGVRRLVSAMLAASLLASCGGGGDNGGTGTGGATVSTGTSGASAAPVFDASYLPFKTAGSVWRFNSFEDSGLSVGTYQLRVTGSDGRNFSLLRSDSLNPGDTTVQDYTLTQAGLVQTLSIEAGGAAVTLQALMYAFPGLAVGEERSFDSGSESASAAGNTVTASLNYSQKLVGIDDEPELKVPQLPTSILHFQNVTRIRTILNGATPVDQVITEDVWLAPNLGPVRIRREVNDGTTTRYTYKLTSLEVGGRTITLQ